MSMILKKAISQGKLKIHGLHKEGVCLFKTAISYLKKKMLFQNYQTYQLKYRKRYLKVKIVLNLFFSNQSLKNEITLQINYFFKINIAPGSDKISVELLKLKHKLFAGPLSVIFNTLKKKIIFLVSLNLLKLYFYIKSGKKITLWGSARNMSWTLTINYLH